MTTKAEKIAVLKLAGYVIRDISGETGDAWKFDWALPDKDVESDHRSNDIDEMIDDAFDHLQGKEVDTFTYDQHESKNLLDSM